MKTIEGLLTGAVLLNSQLAAAKGQDIAIKDLGQVGIDAQAIVTIFERSSGIQLDPNETVRVSGENEGQDLRFETLDSISIVVPIELAAVPANKDSHK